MPKTAFPRPGSTTAPGPMASLAGLLREWLPRQRWFAGKDRPVSDLSLLSMTELFPGCLHLLVQTGHAAVPGSGTAATGDCYQLLLGVRKHLSPRLGRALIGRAEEGPLAGLTVYDALQDPRVAQLLLERLRHPGTAGPLCFEADPSASVPAGLVPRMLDAEQSNSSLVYGDSFILKVFRRIQPGVNPDLEVPGALAGQGCRRVPAPVVRDLRRARRRLLGRLLRADGVRRRHRVRERPDQGRAARRRPRGGGHRRRRGRTSPALPIAGGEEGERQGAR